MARVLSGLGVKKGMVVYGQDKLDKISISAPTTVCEFHEGSYHTYEIRPEEIGFTTCKKEELMGGSPQENAEITKAILSGEPGAKREAVLLNAGAGLYIGGKAESLQEGVKMAAELIDTGKAKKKLEEFIEESNR